MLFLEKHSYTYGLYQLLLLLISLMYKISNAATCLDCLLTSFFV